MIGLSLMAVKEPAPPLGFFVRQTLGGQRGDHEIGDTDARFPRSHKQDLLGRQLRFGLHPNRGVQTGETHCRRALDVVVEAACTVPVLAQEPEGILAGEILELHERPRKHLAAASMNSSSRQSYSSALRRRCGRPLYRGS